jgi:hypothetical protein
VQRRIKISQLEDTIHRVGPLHYGCLLYSFFKLTLLLLLPLLYFFFSSAFLRLELNKVGDTASLSHSAIINRVKGLIWSNQKAFQMKHHTEKNNSQESDILQASFQPPWTSLQDLWDATFSPWPAAPT